MCRYAFRDYPSSYACLPCRHVAQFSPDLIVPPRCPQCRQPLTHLGRDFQAPRKRDDPGWAAVAAVVASGKNYDSCGCNGPGPRPRTKAEAKRVDRPWVPRGRKDQRAT
jgi:hypothetical protein